MADYWYNNYIVESHMLNQGKKNSLQKIFFNQAFLSLVGLIIIVLIGFPYAKSAVKQYKINQEISNFKKEIASLQNKSQDLKKIVAYLDSDQFAEEQARLNLNLKKSGEELTIIKTVDSGLSLASSSDYNQIYDIPGYKKAEPVKEFSNPKKWLNYFFRM